MQVLPSQIWHMYRWGRWRQNWILQLAPCEYGQERQIVLATGSPMPYVLTSPRTQIRSWLSGSDAPIAAGPRE